MRDDNEVLSARIKAMKHAMSTRRSVFLTYGFNDVIVWQVMDKCNYPIRRTDKNASRKLEQDYNRLCELNSTWEQRLSQAFWHGVQIIFGQPRNQQKNLLVAWFSVCRISLGNESPNVMCSVRSREAFQTEAFPTLGRMKREQQNPKLTRLEELGLGEFHKGEAYKRTDAGIFKILLVDDEPTDVSPLFSASTSLLEMHTGSLLVPGSPKDVFLLIMDELTGGYKAFLGYTVSQKEVNAAAKEEFKEANPLPAVEPKPKKVYKPRKHQLSSMEKKAVKEGRAELDESGKAVWTAPTPEPVALDYSHLLDVPRTPEARRAKGISRFHEAALATVIDF